MENEHYCKNVTEKSVLMIQELFGLAVESKSSRPADCGLPACLATSEHHSKLLLN